MRCHALLYWRPSCCILCVWNHALSRLPAIVAGLSAGVVWYISYYFLAGAPLRSSDRAGIWHPVVDDCELRGPLFGCQLDMRFFLLVAVSNHVFLIRDLAFGVRGSSPSPPRALPSFRDSSLSDFGLQRSQTDLIVNAPKRCWQCLSSGNTWTSIRAIRRGPH